MEDAFYIGTDIGGTTFSSAIFDHDLNLIKTSEKGHISDFSKSSSLLDAVANQIKSISAGKKVFVKTNIYIKRIKLTLFFKIHIFGQTWQAFCQIFLPQQLFGQIF